MRKIPLYYPFALALFATLFGSVLFPKVHLSTFAPFLAIVYHAAPISRALWIALGCGTILDLLSSELRFGVYALNFVLITLLLYPQKKHFFEDKPIGLSLFTALIAASSTLLQLVLAHLFDRGVPFSSSVIGIDVLLMSVVDGLYAFLWFTCPLKLYTYIKKMGWKNLIFRKEQTDEE